MNCLIASPSMTNQFSTINLGKIPSINSQYIDRASVKNNAVYKELLSSIDNIFNSGFTSGVSDREYDILCRKLNSFASLENDWDGYDGVPASRELVDFSMHFLSEIYRSFILPNVTLASNGNISFYWKNTQDRFYVEIELDNVGSYNYLVKSYDDVYGEDDVEFFSVGISRKLAQGLMPYNKNPKSKIA